MSKYNKTPDDEAYDNLIQELGLDIDLDEPIGENATDDASDELKLSQEEFFRIEDREAGPQDLAEKDFEDTGVELSAELVAELRSVIMGGPSDDLVQSDSAGADVFAADGVAVQPAPEPPPLAEDAFTYEAAVDEFESDLADTGSVASENWPDESETDEGNESAFDDLIAQLTSNDSSEFPEEQEPMSTDAEEGHTRVEPDVFAAQAVEETEEAEWDISDDEPDQEFDLGAAGSNDELAHAETDVEFDSDVAEQEEIEEDGFDLGFDAGVILREVLEGRRADETQSKFDMSDLIEDVDAEATEESISEAGEAAAIHDENGSLADVLGRALEDALSESAEADDHHDYTENENLYSEEQDSGSIYSSVETDDEFSALDAIDDRPLSDFDGTSANLGHQTGEAELSPTSPAGVEDDVVYSFNSAGDDAGDRLVPRISLHAFCRTAPVTQLMMAAQNDRRMANVSMEVHQGGSAAAFDYYADRSTPHLLIVETTGSPANILAELDQLAERCDENVKVIVVGAANDIRLYRELMYRGVSEYIVPPMETVQLIRSVANLFVDPEQPFVGKSIAVTGVKGGVGSSTIAHNLAWVMSQRMESNTTLVDLDLNFGTTGLDFNEESQQTIADAILSPDRFDEAVLERLLTRATDHLSLFTAPATLDRTYDLDVETFEHVMGLVRQSVPFVVLDLPHIWADWFKSAVVGADEIVVVAQPELASLRNGKNLIDFLKAARPNDAPPRLVINNVGVPKRPEIPVKDFAAALDVEPELVLPFDPQLFGTAANNGQMINEVAPDSKCAQGMDYLAALLTGREPPIERQASLLNKFFKR